MMQSSKTLLRIIGSFVHTHYQRLLSMSMIFTLVVMLIVLVQQVISNLDRQVSEQTRPIVGADMIVSSSQPISGEVIDMIREYIIPSDGKAIQQVEFYTTIETSQEPLLVEVKGVESGYPLYDGVVLDSFNTTDRQTGAYIDPSTYDQLNQASEVNIGEIEIPIVGLIQNQQSISFNLVDQGRSIIIPYELVNLTQLTEFGSRVSYEVLIKLDDEDALVQLQTQLENLNNNTIRVSLARDRVQQLGGIIDQVNQYISIILILTVVLSLLIMSIATMTMSWKIARSLAVMKILGLTQGMVGVVMMILYGSMFVIGSVLGRYLAKRGVGLIASRVGQTLVRDGNVGWTVVIVAVTSFVIACRQPIRNTMTTPALQLLKQNEESQSLQSSIISSIVLGVGSLVILWVLTNNLLFSLIIVIIAVITIGVGRGLLIKLFARGFDKANSIRSNRFDWRDVIRSTTLAGNQTGLIVGGVSIVLVCYAIITSVSVSFLERLNIDTGDQANIFVLNIKDEDIPKIQTIEPNAEVFDIILTRIQSINNISLENHLLAQNKGTGDRFNREFNVTSVQLQDKVTQGDEISSGGVSLDEGFAEDLGVVIGDQIKLSIQGRVFDLEVIGLRITERNGAGPFFYIQVDSAQFADAPKTWFWTSQQSDVISFKRNVIDQLGNGVSFIDVGAIVEVVRTIASTVINIIIICMAIVILLIMSVSIANNEASALINKRSYRLYHLMGMTKSDLMTKIWRTVGLYSFVIMVLLIVIMPSILIIIFRSTSLFSRSIGSLVPVIGGIMLSLCLIIGSYVLFHRRIVLSVVTTTEHEE